MSRMVVFSIGLYQRWLSPVLPRACRFHPTCSEYARLSFQEHPFWLASWKSLGRLLRCHPFHPGGVDHP
ncbi:MAG: membrane protein insertion efficiency factor YidD [Acidobacteriota bacterium]|nr:membrane protein insertion efficiency factor YidD [Acidobacteriota bacterium]